jgi:hypothetical protein
MRSLSDADLLTAWEKGHVAARSASGPLSLLSAAYPDESFHTLAHLSIGKRDALLLELRERLFGSRLTGLADCAVCHQVLEIPLDLSSLRLPGEEASTDSLVLETDGYEIEFHLPNSLDLIAIADSISVISGRLRLLERLVSSSRYQGNSISVRELPEEIVRLVEEKMSAAEPQADIQLNLTCTVCGQRNETLFDIASFLWKEVDILAIRLLRETHELAHAYGWSEAEIVKMSSWRRRCYMEMLSV